MVMPATEKLIIQEGDKLQIRCMGRSRIKFSTQENWANVSIIIIYHIPHDRSVQTHHSEMASGVTSQGH